MREEDENSIEYRVKEVISQQLEVPSEKYRASARLVDDLGADSLAITEMVAALDEAFEIEIPDDDMEKLVTVGDVLAYIKARVGG